MTRDEARSKLAGTWCFNHLKDAVVLREVALIEAVQTHRAAHFSAAPKHSQVLAQPPRPL